MTEHYFENSLVKLHYYKYGSGEKKMLCFHGYGMHGKQFRLLEAELGSKYTFYGFDLFFHKETKLHDQTLGSIKKGFSKKSLANLILDFCQYEQIDKFSVIGYSMGTHYASVLAEEIPERINELILAAPSSLNPGAVVKCLSKNRIGNKLLEKLMLSDKALITLLRVYRKLGFIDQVSHDILYKEINTPELRFNFYACITYLRFLETDRARLIKALSGDITRSIFIFGKRDKAYPPSIGNWLATGLSRAEIVVLDENHEMINRNFSSTLSALLQ